MYVVAWESASGIHAYGPFLGSEEGMAWCRARFAFMDPSQHRVVGYLLTEPYEQQDYGSSVREVGSCYHQGRDADDRAAGFIATVVVSETVSFGVGAFSTREAAAGWFLANRMLLDGAQGLILPLLSPAG